MFLNLMMILLLVGLYVLCAALIRFAEGVVGPQGQGPGKF